MRHYFVIIMISILSGPLFGLEADSKKTTLYIVRHGLTDWNILGKLQGHADIPLNETGRAEAAELSQRINGIDFDICFSSDLQRAMETSRILTAPSLLPIKSVPALRERNFRLWEGRLFSELTEYMRGDQPFPDIETDEEIRGRILPLLDEIVVNYPGATVLVVTHGSVMRSLLIHLLKIDSSSILGIQVKTLATLQLVASKGQYAIQEMTGIHFNKD